MGPGVRDGDLGILDGHPHAAAHVGGRAAAELLGRGPPGVALPAGGCEGHRGQHAASRHVAPHQAPVAAHVAAGDQEGGAQGEGRGEAGNEEEFDHVGHEGHPVILGGGSRILRRYPWPMEPEAPGGTGAEPPLPGPAWQPGVPSVREHIPSLVFGAALPIGAYFLVRGHVRTDAQALIAAGCFSVGWIVLQFVRQRKVDVVGAAVLLGFAVGVVSSTLLGGNAYVLKVRDGFFTALFGVACIVTLYTHDRPALFYVGRYLSAGSDPDKMSAFDRLHELPVGRHTFRVLSAVWGIGLVVEASCRLALADVVPTGTFLAISPFITASVIGSLFAFTAVYAKRTQLDAAMRAGIVTDVRPEAGPENPEQR